MQSNVMISGQDDSLGDASHFIHIENYLKILASYIKFIIRLPYIAFV